MHEIEATRKGTITEVAEKAIKELGIYTPS